MSEYELGEVKGELSQINRGIDRLSVLAEKTLETTAGNSAMLGKIEKTLDKHETWLRGLEELLAIQRIRIDDIDDKVIEHIKNDVPINAVVGKWSARIVWAALTAAGGLVVAYLHRWFFNK
jgi:hypothetical protein